MSLANKISIFRILLIPFFIGVLVYYSPQKDFLRITALVIFIVAMLTDVVDGHIARSFKEETKLGSFLDPMADKLLILSTFICFAFIKALPASLRLPPWVLIVIITRDVMIVLGSVMIYVIKGDIKIIPSKLGKIATLLQMLTVVCLLLMFPYTKVLWMIMVVFTILSAIGYIVRGNRVLNCAAVGKV